MPEWQKLGILANGSGQQIVVLTRENMKNNVGDVYGILLASINILRKFSGQKQQGIVPSM